MTLNMPKFLRLNEDWGAEPNVPLPEVSGDEGAIYLRFYLNSWLYKAQEWEMATIGFTDCQKWRLGPVNDEGWYLGQCRYSKIAPAWGEFYEIIGNDDRRDAPDDWSMAGGAGERHFLFYFRDETFECLASSWSYEAGRAPTPPAPGLVGNLSRQDPRTAPSRDSAPRRTG